MAYNNVFPVSYPQAYVPQYTQAQAPQPQTGIIWVQGEAGAKSYLVAPNTTVQLWDSESQTIYLKSADGSGMPTIKTLDYTIRDQVAGPASNLMKQSEYVTHDELSAFEDKIRKMIDKKEDEDGKPAF